ncbi:MAG: aminopeptidase P family protein [Chloroflexi bacterium]|nr:aminopeptidase P family protein [Chloroflexota bacterium]
MRLEKLRKKLGDENLDAILITNAANRRYMSGFTGSTGTLVISQDHALLATDFRYYEQVEKNAPDFELAQVTTKFADLLPDLVGQVACQRLGFESEDVTFALHRELSDALPDGVELVPTTEIVEEIRAEKDDGELVSLQRAIDLTDAAYVHIAASMQPGMTEREVAWELESFMRTHGAEELAFIQVGSGPNGAMPHAVLSDRKIEIGSPIVIDMGAVVGGYRSDLTRTIALGEASAQYTEVYEIVRQAHEAAVQGVRPGMTGKEADALARDVIKKAGYGDKFGHGLGHGVGLVIHERPWVSHRRDGGKDRLRAGMVFTIEPGIYLPGEFGVRLEDIVILREDGAQMLSHAPKDLLIVR